MERILYFVEYVSDHIFPELLDVLNSLEFISVICVIFQTDTTDKVHSVH